MLVELRKLTVDNADGEIYEMAREIGPGENGFVNGFYQEQLEDFHAKVKRNWVLSEGVDLEPQYVPQTIYWLYIDEHPVGYGKLRHRLNDKLREHGGHIGYVIRPSCRGRGYGTIMLRELLVQAKSLGIEEILLTCDETNAASRAIIVANRGELERIRHGTCKYWIRFGS